MKKVFFFLTAIVLTAACSGDALSPDAPAAEETVLVDLALESAVLQTKGGADYGENRVNNVTLLAFDSGGNRLVYEKFNGTTASNLCLPGKKNIKIYAIVNSTYDFDKILTYTNFKKAVSPFASNVAGNFEMVGRVDTTFLSDCSLTIPVGRLATKFHIGSIRINNAVNSASSSPNEKVEWHTLNTVYIMNAASTYPYSLERATSSRFISKDENNPLLYHVMESGYENISEGGHWYNTYDEPMDFYFYPNTSKTTLTRLVLYLEGTSLIESDGGFYVLPCSHYYYIRLPELLPNTMYDIRQLTVENVEFDANSSSKRSLDLKVEYSMDIMDISDGRVLGTVRKKEVAYAM